MTKTKIDLQALGVYLDKLACNHGINTPEGKALWTAARVMWKMEEADKRELPPECAYCFVAFDDVNDRSEP